MPLRPLLPPRLITTAIWLSLPAAGVLLVLMIGARLNPVAALVAWGAMAFCMGCLLRPYFQDLAVVSTWIRTLAAGGEMPPPQLRHGPAIEEIVGAVAQLRRAGQARRAELSAVLRWNEMLFDSLPDPLLLLDPSRRMVRANQAARQVFGEKVVGRDLSAVLRDPAVLEACDIALAGQHPEETEFIFPGAVERSFRVRLERLGDSPAGDAAVVLALHDLTTVRRMEQMRADFIANASHELRTPLATLSGFIETLRGPARDDAPARERFLGIMQETAARMTRLVNDLLSLSRIELSEHSAPSQAVDLAAVVETTIESVRSLAKAKDMTIILSIAEGARVVVGQSDELVQLVLNLLDNAIKYGRDGTDVTVSLETVEGRLAAAGGRAIQLSVQDQGEGIAREHLPRLTERFYRVNTARSRKLGGTGLGLAIVKHIVNRHRGVLNVDSVPGKGSRFSVCLPAMTEEDAMRADQTDVV